MWTSIKEIFTKNHEIKKLREEIQSKKDALQDYYQIIETLDKEREIDSKLYTDKREKLYQDQQSKYEIELLAKDEQIEKLGSKIKYYENINEPQHQNKESFSTQSIPRKTESQTTINKILYQDLKKYREKVRKNQTHIMKSDLLPELEKKHEKLSYQINSRLKQQHIILDTNILLLPTNLNQDEVTRKSTNLEKLLNQINNNSFTPVIYLALNTEYKKFLKQLLVEIKNGHPNWLEDYPAGPLVFYLQKSREAPQEDDNYNNDFRINQKNFRKALTPEEEKELAESGQGNKQYDIIHAVTAITTNAILVTEDHGLLRLKNNPKINLKAYPLTSQEVSNNFNVPILNYLDSLITST